MLHNSVSQQKKIVPNSIENINKERCTSAYKENIIQQYTKKQNIINKINSSSITPPKKEFDLKESQCLLNQNLHLFSHLKNHKIVQSSLIGKSYLKIKLNSKYCSKTAFPTKENTRKNSPLKLEDKNLENKINIKDIEKGKFDLKKNCIYANKLVNGHIKNNYQYSNICDTDRQNSKNKSKLGHSSNFSIHEYKKDKNIYEKNNKIINKYIPVKYENKDIKKKEIISEIIIFKNKSKDCHRQWSPDRDIDNEENRNDNLLKHLNNNIEANYDYLTNTTSNANASFESNMSIQSEAAKCIALTKEVDLIINYITKYFNKFNSYPSTKIHFYKYGRLLGKGAFGKVNLSLHVLTGRLVAIKSINKNKIKVEKQRAKINLETSIMKKLSKSNYVVKILEDFETQKHICIVMEYICAGDLLSYIKKRSKLTEPLAKYIFKQIMVGLYYIHCNSIVHLDIKLDNILIDLDNKVKICDFGVSKKIKKGQVMTEQCGTPAYMAPEIIRGQGYGGYAVDSWSVGVVLYSMLSGTIPFKGDDIKDLNKVILSGKYKEIEGISREASHLISRLLEVDPKRRITDEAVLSHPWLTDVDISEKNIINLFTNSERILLAQSNVDYRDISKKENMVENFSLKNLDTNEDKIQKNIQTKSNILAPYNSSYSDGYLNDEIPFYYCICDQDNCELKTKNNILKFNGKTKELNRNYELNNNGEIDNGIIITQNDSVNDNINNKYNSPNKYSNYFSPITGISPFEPVGHKKCNEYLECGNKINESVIRKMKKLGFNKAFILKCIENNEFNYATSTYFLLSKYNK